MILLTGATGFTGRFVAKELLSRNIPFKCLIRDVKKAEWLVSEGIECVEGNVKREEDLKRAICGTSGIINIVSFNQDNISLLIRVSKEFGLRRVLFIGTTAIFTKLNAESKALRIRIESEIFNSSLDWTILRPTMIYGAPGDRNMERLIKAIKKFPIHPILGSGKYKIQPIYVKDLSHAIIEAFFSEKTYKKAYNLSGKMSVTYKDCINIVAELLDKKIVTVPLPVKLSYYMAEFCRIIPCLPKIKGEQVLRLNEDKDFSHKYASVDFGFSPIGFEDGIRFEINDLLKQ